MDRFNHNLPVTLENCPIVDAVAEVRFLSGIPKQAVFGILYEKLKDHYPGITALPILQVPPAVLEIDPNLHFKPHYRLQGLTEKFFLQIGPDVLTVSPTMPYPGWSLYWPEIQRVFTTLISSGVLKSIIRIGVRYTNFFPGDDLFSRVNLGLSLQEKPVPFKNTLLRTEFSAEDGFFNTLQMASGAKQEQQSTDGKVEVVQRPGCVLDIDTFKNYEHTDGVQEFIQDISKGHDIEKQFFWDILKDEARRELKPIY